MILNYPLNIQVFHKHHVVGFEDLVYNEVDVVLFLVGKSFIDLRKSNPLLISIV